MAQYPPTAKINISRDRVAKIVLSRPRPYYSRSGTKDLAANERLVTVTFATALADANWIFAGLTFWNSADAEIDIIQLQAMGRIAKSASGFTVLLNVAPPTDNYKMDWSIAEAYNP